MDGSKRSRHSNAFFTGFGRFRKIVLFDTLIAQLTEPELESVLAHEIGHYKKRHVLKLLGVSIAGVFVAFAAIAWLARQQWFYRAFGFEHQGGFAAANVVPAMLLFALLAGTISFWLSPFIHTWSRRFEYEADAFARATMGEAQSTHSCTAQIERKKSEQSHSAPALQRLLLLASDPARTGTRAANSRFERLSTHSVLCLATSRHSTFGALQRALAASVQGSNMSRIIVVGAGINGVTAAIELKKARSQCRAR